MNTGWTLYAKWKAKQGYPSDNAARLRLGVERATISGWKNGKSPPNEDAVKLMSKDLGEDFRGYLLEIEAERSKSETIKSLLHDAAKKFAPFAAIILLGLIHSQNANCGEVDKYNSPQFNINTDSLYIHTNQKDETEVGLSVFA
jgi:transcriptional regulator with XRE-family HTH domain